MSFLFYNSILMEFMNSLVMNSLVHSFTSRGQAQYQEVSESINNLIEELGGKVQKELINIQERTLLAYKDSLLDAQQAYKDLQEGKNDEAIKQNILALKASQERAYQQATEKSLEMSRIYDKLKLELKQVQEYSHELELQLHFLTKQTRLAKAKAEALDLETGELQQRRQQQAVCALQRNQSIKQLTRLTPKEEPQGEIVQPLHERRLRDKIQQLEEFLQLAEAQESPLETILGRFDFDSIRSQRQKGALFMQLFSDREFKRFLYTVLYSKRGKGSS